ncbi:phenylalanine 4-monooxygenase [Niveispirillum sp. KHB5.9]|uniref:phenylalanine 4-monooxygenase n=1 Tax=Niveispirillum sp. KHB5.9 TaxID=3400269 RepID=UPI003A88BD74
MNTENAVTGDFAARVADSGKTDTALRGDYSAVRADYTIDQGWDRYTDTDHAMWRTLYDRQSSLLERYAAPEFIEGLKRLDVRDAIPDFRRASDVLDKATGWTLVAVPGLIPEREFFEHLAARRFPVTNWIRKPEEMDYLVEPDVFHDFFGHVPLLAHPVFADYMQAYGVGGAKAIANSAQEQLTRLYWYMVEFGLINTKDGLRAYGAGMLSSRGETQFCIDSPSPHRVGFDLERVMRTQYRIDDYQQTYFVLDSYEQLMDATAVDFTPIYARLKTMAEVDPTTVLPTDRIFTLGTQGGSHKAA